MNYQVIATKFKEKIDNATNIVIMQADNPDGDSLSSALALESILEDYGKKVYLYCSIDIPDYLRYLDGWDRVLKDFPSKYDLAIIVDTGVWKLFGNLTNSHVTIPKQKLIVIDEHDVDHTIEADLDIHDSQAVASGQIVYEVASAAKLPIQKISADFIASSILSDTLGLTSISLKNNGRPFEIMADLVRLGVDVSELQEKRLENMKINPNNLIYKGQLLQRVEFHSNDRIATITIPYDEIIDKNNEFNPTIVLDETRFVRGVAVTIGFKQYVSQGRLVRVTGRIRCNRGFEIAAKLASCFEDGGGHPYASGFKIEGNDLNFDDIKNKAITEAERLLDETVQSED